MIDKRTWMGLRTQWLFNMAAVVARRRILSLALRFQCLRNHKFIDYKKLTFLCFSYNFQFPPNSDGTTTMISLSSVICRMHIRGNSDVFRTSGWMISFTWGSALEPTVLISLVSTYTSEIPWTNFFFRIFQEPVSCFRSLVQTSEAIAHQRRDEKVDWKVCSFVDKRF